MTQRCGFKPNEEEYLMTGLSAYGKGGDYVGKIFSELIGMIFMQTKYARGIVIGNQRHVPKRLLPSQTVYTIVL